jgi:glucose/arabinose dehydrogenase
VKKCWTTPLLIGAVLSICGCAPAQDKASNVPPPQAPFTDYRYEKPGAVHHITPKDLPAPFATKSATNGPNVIDRPANALPVAPPGFKVELFATGFNEPRAMTTAPNGDIFVAESHGGKVTILHGVGANGKPQQTTTFASGLKQPYGIAFYPPGPNPQYVYIGDTDAILRFAYKNGDLKATGSPEKITDVPGGPYHWTRDIVFSQDGKRLFVGIGSDSNIDDPDTHPKEKNTADVLVMDPDGKNMRVYASGIRNPGGGLAINPKTGELWCSVNERDGLGNNLVPDYITHVQDGGFYGWPYFYIGGNPEPRLKGAHPELKSKVIVPDVLIQPHNASLQLAFYEGKQFPAEYRGDIFAAQHGSWNRDPRVGYEVIRVPLHQTGKATGEYEDFLTGFVMPNGQVWGRPVGVTVMNDGSLLVSDDGSNSIWRVSYTRAK